MKAQIKKPVITWRAQIIDEAVNINKINPDTQMHIIEVITKAWTHLQYYGKSIKCKKFNIIELNNQIAGYPSRLNHNCNKIDFSY